MAPIVPIESLAEAALDSERLLLGLCLLEPDRFREIELAVQDFGVASHRTMFTVLNELGANSELWDSRSVIDALRERSKLEDAGGCAYIADLTTGIPRNAAVQCHIHRVRNASVRRRIASALYDGLNRAQDAAADPASILSDIMGTLELVASGMDAAGNILPYSVNDGGATRSPELVCLADVPSLEVEWLWEPYLPVGMLSMLSGDPGGGKTFISLAIAAALSRGETPHTKEPRKPIRTLYLSLENSPEHVIRPRFDLLGGDARSFHLLSGTVNNSGPRKNRGSISLQDVDILEMALNRTQAQLLVVDPIQSYFGADVDTHRSNETRPILDGLARLANQSRCCILLVRHLSKSSGGRAIHRGLGSIDLTGAVRTELMAGTAADDASNRALVQVKSNLGSFGESLGFAIDDSGFRWTGKSPLTPTDLLAPESEAESRSEIAGATDFLYAELTNGPVLQKELIVKAHFGERTLQRAAKLIGVEKKRDGERGPWLWKLPAA